jgi:hypothetical protein
MIDGIIDDDVATNRPGTQDNVGADHLRVKGSGEHERRQR